MKLPAIFSDKRVRYGSYSVVMIVAVIAILLTANLLVSQVSLRWDNSGQQMYSISEESIEIVKDLQSEVTIYTLFRTGSEVDLYADIIGQYAANSPNITVENRDPYLYPAFVQQYTGGGEAPTNSVIVVCGEKYRVISSSDFIEYTFDYETYTNNAESIKLEPLVTNAIRYVTSGRTIKLYFSTGRGQRQLPDGVKAQIALEGYVTEEINLLSAENIPNDCDILILTTPEQDISVGERETIERYLSGGGNLIALIDRTDTELVQIQTLLGAYGMALDGSYILEGDAAYTIQGQPYFCLPVIEDFAIGNPLRERNYSVLIAFSQGITPLEVRKQAINLYPILTTSDKAFGKIDPSPKTMEMEPGDIQGPLHLAMAAEDLYSYEKPVKLVVFGTVNFLESDFDTIVSGANLDLFMNSLGWLSGDEQSVYVRPKSLLAESLQINGAQQMMLLAVSLIVIPFSVLIFGVVRWLRRRHK